LLIEGTTIVPWFLQEIGAEFSAFVGKIYEAFKETTHVRKHEFNPAWPNYMAIDWGFTNPFAAIEFQVDPWDNILIWREHYRAYLTLPQHLEVIKQRENPPGYHLDLAFADAADPGSAIEVSQHLVQCYALPEAKSGVTKGGKQESGWREGVDLVNSFLKLRQTGEADEFGTPLEVPKLFVDHSCTNTIREFNNYRAPSTVGRVLRNPREDAQKYDDHALDAIRYALMHIFKLGARHRLSEVYTMSDFATHTSEASAFSELASFAPGSESGYFSMADLEQF
jgi:phage terminase large subunit